MKKHIAILLSADPEGGGKFQYSLATLDALCSFSEQDFKISAIYLDDHWGGFIPSPRCNVYKCRKGIIGRVLRKALLNLPFGLRLWREINIYVHPLHKLLGQLKSDLILYPGGDSVVYESGLPGVSPIFDLMHRYEPSFPEVSANGLAKKRDAHYEKVCQYAKAILVSSQLGKQHVMDCYRVDERKIFVFPYVAPPYVWNAQGSSDVLERYHLPERYIFYPAQLWKHKNHTGILRAMSLLKQQGLSVNAVFAGSRQNGADEVFREMEKLDLQDQVFYLEYVDNDEVVALYKNSVALVMATFFGPTNIPQLEAFALGCPVVTSNVYGIQEQVGAAALLFDPYDVEDIAEKISMVWTNEDLRQELIQKGLQRAQEWNREKFAARLLSIVAHCV